MSNLVAKARAALDGVTPGEWTVVSDPDKGQGFVGLSISASEACVIGGCGCCGSPFGDNVHDARFIAAARSLVPDMADRIEALEAENARLREAERTAWEPPPEAESPYTLALGLRKLIADVTRPGAAMSEAMRQQLAAYATAPAPEARHD